MNRSILARGGALVMVGMIASACTMKKQEAPSVSGPSEFGTAITIALTPDVIAQDGASTSIVTVTARGPNGAPLSSVPLRAEIRVNGTPTDFGALSARSLLTGTDGRATIVYTAPPALTFGVDQFTIVDIGVTPLGSDFGNSTTRFASLRLVPRGVVVPPAGLSPSFTLTPIAPTDNQLVLFDASASQAPSNNPIATYAWNFGDGGRSTGRTTNHSYDSAGTYVVVLTISDALGRSAETSRSLTVSPGTNPSASFVFSPTTPLVNQQVNFNAVGSTPAPGRQIVTYVWDFGDGTPAVNGPQTSHRFTRIGTYTITLTVTDDAGRTSTVSLTVPIA